MMKKNINVSLFSKDTLNDLEMISLKGGESAAKKANCSCPKEKCPCPITNEKCPSCEGIIGGGDSTK
jgi:hypothetical protein